MKKKVILERVFNSINIVQSLSMIKTNSHHNYEGVIYKNAFNLRRIPKLGYSAFLPILSCVICEKEDYVHLSVNVQFNKYVSGLLLIFVGIQLLPLIFGSSLNITLLIGAYIFIIYLFNKETQSLKDKLNKIIFIEDDIRTNTK